MRYLTRFYLERILHNMKNEKTPLTIEEFSAQLGNQRESTPEIKAFGQLATIESPVKVEQAIDGALSWGWF